MTQRLNLLKLEPELHDALRSGMPVRMVRDLHSRSRDDQLAALDEWRRVAATRERADDERHTRQAEGDQADDEPAVKQRYPNTARQGSV